MKQNIDTRIPYKSTRFPVTAAKGMVCTGSSLAANAGLRILQQGGNAVDAAIATAACLSVVEPTANGIGSDCFALVWMKDKLYGLNGSGCSPAELTLDYVNTHHDAPPKMPTHGWTPVTVPGTPRAWADLSARFGQLPFTDVLAPAIEYARNGFPVSVPLARMWKRGLQRYQALADQSFLDAWYATFTFAGKAPSAGDIVRLPHHGDTLEELGRTMSESFYSGRLAEQIDLAAKRHGGCLRKSDLEAHRSLWVNPISINYRGYDIWEIPPNGQGIVALMALNALKHDDLRQQCAQEYHLQFEAMKAAFQQGYAIVGDTSLNGEGFQNYLSDDYGRQMRSSITDSAQEFGKIVPAKSGTVYLCSADQWGNMVSLIQSNYMGFGSGVVVEDTGISLQNRGADFSLHPEDINVLAPGKRTYHTIIPGFITKDDQAVGPFGVMGGYMQPQGHVQLINHFIDHGYNPQAALDAPRWQWTKAKYISVEQSFPQDMIDQLKALGHLITIESEPAAFGRGQMIIRLPNGVYVGGTESRTDGCIASW